MKTKTHKIKVKEDIKLEENLFNFKRWFNGIKQFSSLKVSPKPLTEELDK